MKTHTKDLLTDAVLLAIIIVVVGGNLFSASIIFSRLWEKTHPTMEFHAKNL